MGDPGAEALNKRSGFTDEDLHPLVTGKEVLPNFEELSLERGIANIAAGAGLIAYAGVKNAKIPRSKSSWGHWARYFFGSTQGGVLDGTGYVIWWESDHGVGKGHVGRFAICKHEKVATAGAKPMRGWHPGFCTKCGLDMTVDSGD